MIWFRSDRYKCDFEYFRICLRNRLFNLKRSWEGGVMLWFVPKNYFDAEFSRNNYFCKQNARKQYSDARFSPIKIAFFLLHGWNHSPPFKLKGRFLTRFHYYIFFTWVWMQWYFLWPLSSCCWGSLNGICISCEVPSIADTMLGISEQYHFLCHQTGISTITNFLLVYPCGI